MRRLFGAEMGRAATAEEPYALSLSEMTREITILQVGERPRALLLGHSALHAISPSW